MFENVTMNMTCNILDVENIYLECNYLIKFDITHLVDIHIQTNLYFFGGFFNINDDLPIDILNLQILQCIIYKSKQTSIDVLS